MNFQSTIYQLSTQYFESIPTLAQFESLTSYLHQSNITTLWIPSLDARANNPISLPQIASLCQQYHLSLMVTINPEDTTGRSTFISRALSLGVIGFYDARTSSDRRILQENCWLLTDHIPQETQTQAIQRIHPHVYSKSMSVTSIQTFIHNNIHTRNNQGKLIALSLSSPHLRLRLLDIMAKQALYHEESAKCFALLQMTQASIPIVYQGDELGMMSRSLPWYQWKQKKALHSNQTDAHHFMNKINDALHQPNSIANFYQALLAFRFHHPTLASGNAQAMLAHHRQIICFVATSEEETLLVLLNISNKSAKLDFKQAMEGECLFASYPAHKQLHRYMILIPYEGLVYRLPKIECIA